ncbi:MAG: SDR family oxidoreductase [Chloroflexota bacterium]|nr:SDR family oxidoreductase [Chloroflexota bacterium]MDE2909611.1 SDR family oxidoreductase [Chloroflexota bacterium]
MPKTIKCDPQLLRKDLSERVYIVTGANSGTGLATSRQLVRQGAHVVGACRRVSAGEAVFADFARLPGSAEIMKLDLASLASVRQFAACFLNKRERLDGLVNNAGLVTSEGRTEDGFEIQFGTNHLGHFLLTELLLDILKASAPARIVSLSSVVHAGRGNQTVTIDFEDLHYERKPYSAMAAYAQSKLANILHAQELARRLDGTEVTAYSVHPGWIRSNFGADVMPGWLRGAMNLALRPFSGLLGIMSPEDGAQTTLHCLLDDDAPMHNGAYFSQNSILYPNREHRAGGWPMRSPNPNTRDEALAIKLYDVSSELVGLSKQ